MAVDAAAEGVAADVGAMAAGTESGGKGGHGIIGGWPRPPPTTASAALGALRGTSCAWLAVVSLFLAAAACAVASGKGSIW